MSYDLFFRTRGSATIVTHGEFETYFSGRPHYQVNTSQAWYNNEDTGVYFVFEYDQSVSPDDEESDDDDSLLPISFNMDYCRPHVFGLEAEPEVRHFVTHFDTLVFDPQTHGMEDGEYSTDGFLRGWNAGNAYACRAILSGHPTSANHSLPTATINSIWKWNFQREARQTEIGDNAFVPHIFAVSFNNRVATTVVWADGVSILLPKVDIVFVPRTTFGPRRLFRSPAKDTVLMPWAEIAPVLNHFRELPGEITRFELFYDKPPVEIERLIRNARPAAAMPKGLNSDEILDQELLETARRSRP
jgi:hypothetical protein